ncbi:hypothetical protein O3G_MSEX009104 [Manduca sexta]|uniref:Gamma-interferon-inducible lysosomal thiol reductase n=1 Tax=Manduca sexta TaxID=7130 RepID=A0A921ZE59_MANSE|nr:hypothetical protein O3G_MSEX009104 [Manduca sexta]
MPFPYITKQSDLSSTIKSNDEHQITNEDTDMTAVEKVNVKIYYETLCPYCINFFVYYLQPEIVSLHKYLNIRLYPYGNAETKEEGDHYEITCQHGESECYGNKLHACAIDIIKNVTKSTLYNCCLMGNQSDDNAATECGVQMKIDADPIKECAKSDKGNQLLKDYGEKSMYVGYPGVPFILVDGKTSSADVFKKDICEAFIEPPPPCKT